MGHHGGIGRAAAVVHITEVVVALRQGGDGDDAVGRVEAGSAVIPSVGCATGVGGQRHRSTFADHASVGGQSGGCTGRDGHCLYIGRIRAEDITHLIGDGHAPGTTFRHCESRFGGIAFFYTIFYPYIFHRGAARGRAMEGGGQHCCRASAFRSRQGRLGFYDFCEQELS